MLEFMATTAIMSVKKFSKSKFDRMEALGAETIREHHTIKNNGGFRQLRPDRQVSPE